MLLCACSCCLVAAPGDLCLACVYACQVVRMGRKNAVMSSLNCYLITLQLYALINYEHITTKQEQ